MSCPGYNLDLRSMPPFMYVERYRRFGDIGILAFGAYNAMGLIGPEKGGIAVVSEAGKRVIATKDFPYDPKARALEFEKLARMIDSPREWSPRGTEGMKSIEQKIIKYAVESGYDVR